MTHRVSYAGDTVTIVIPLRLLRTPRWVRLGASTEVNCRALGPRGFFLTDNPFNHARHSDALTVGLHRP